MHEHKQTSHVWMGALSPWTAISSRGYLGEVADVVAHDVLELARAELAVVAAEGPVLREAREVRRRDVDAGGEILPPPRHRSKR